MSLYLHQTLFEVIKEKEEGAFEGFQSPLFFFAQDHNFRHGEEDIFLRGLE